MANHTGKKAGARAEVQRIAAEFGLGRHVKVWRRGWSKTSERAFRDQDGDEHFYGYLLQDHAGNTVELGKRAHELRAGAEQVLAARLSRPAH